MFDRLRFLLTGRVGNVHIPLAIRLAVLRSKEPEPINDDWMNEYWWPESPKDLENKWKDEDGRGGDS